MTGNPVALKLGRGATLPDEERRILDDMLSDVRRVAPREEMIREGERPEHVHAVLEGFACRYKILADGGRQIVAWLVPGDFCDLHVHILGRMDHTIAALSACRVAYVPRARIEAVTALSSTLSRAFWWATLVDEAMLREWMVGMGRRSADRQIAHLLCEMHARLGAVGLVRGDSFDFPVTQDELADSVGMSGVHVNRVLQQLRHQGLITLEGKVLTIHAPADLRAFAEFDPNYLHLG